MSNSILSADKKLKAHAQEALEALKAANVTIVTAESCTAGTVAALLAQAEGSSDILHGGFITYTKEHKTKGLGIPWRLLKEQGAVNGDVVKQLAAGALERSPASMAIAISGVLGPEPDEDGNPVGLVYFCLIRKDQEPTVVKEEFGNQPHEELLEKALHRAFALIEASVSANARKHARKNPPHQSRAQTQAGRTPGKATSGEYWSRPRNASRAPRLGEEQRSSPDDRSR